jgi:ribosome recycling factor
MVGAVEKAIRESSLGLNPITEGTLLRLPIPELNTERRKELVKLAHKYAEATRVSVRHVRRDGMDELKELEKEGLLSEDTARSYSDKVQKLTDDTIAEIDRMLGSKEQEIMQV